jgi:hypothetical protein
MLTDVTNHIIQGIKHQCSQIQVKDDIITNDEHAFECPTYPRKSIVYSAQLRGNELTNTSVLVTCLDDWIQLQETPEIVVGGVGFKINKECTSVVNDVNSSLDCQTKQSLTLAEIFDIVLGILLVAAIIVIICIVGCPR